MPQVRQADTPPLRKVGHPIISLNSRKVPCEGRMVETQIAPSCDFSLPLSGTKPEKGGVAYHEAEIKGIGQEVGHW